MKSILFTSLLLSAPTFAMAGANPLDGKYQLDFYASSGQCAEEVYVQSSLKELVMTKMPNESITHFRLGSFCHDRVFGNEPPRPIWSCTNEVETNSLSEGGRAFESLKNATVVIDGVGYRRNYSRFTLVSLEGRLQADLVGFDREGVVERPVFRCFYDKVN